MNRLPLLAVLLPVLCGMPARAQDAATTTMRSAGTVARAAPPGLRVVATQRLPRSPASRREEFCRHLFVEPRTPAGRQVAAHGWAVTAEGSLGPYQVVSFVRAAEPGTSGSCLLQDGNIGFFRGADLVAIAYATGGGAAIGRVRPLGADGLRIWDGDFLSQPVADLRLAADGSPAVAPLAAEEPVCGGRATVPNIYGQPIDRARGTLERSGWLPAPPDRREGRDSRVDALLRQGVPEVESCSGTGFAYCAFGYRGAAGMLHVSTAGDDELPSVAGYGVDCAPR